MSKKTAFLISIVSATIVSIFTLALLSKVEISPSLGVSILLAFGVWGLTRGALYTITGTHIVVGWKRVLWHLIPLASAGLVLVFVGGANLGGKTGWTLVEAGLDTIPGVSTAKAYELRRSGETALDRLILSPVKGIWTTATKPVAKEYGELKTLLASFGAQGKSLEVPLGSVVIYAGQPINLEVFMTVPGFEFGLKRDGVDTKIRSTEKLTDKGYANIFSGTDLKTGETYEVFVSRWSSDVPEKSRKEVKQEFTWEGKDLIFQVTVR